MERLHAPDDDPLGGWAWASAQYPLPHHLLSRIVNAATRTTYAPFKDLLIRRFMHRFGVDLREAAEPDPGAYASFNGFFTRALREDARPLAPGDDAIASPVDGIVYQAGDIRNGRMLQAKGRDFSLVELLGGLPGMAAPFFHGHFCSMYLAPADYHRVHAPLDATLRRMLHVPGRLFSVNPATVQRVPRIFARNERVACVFDTQAGPMGVVLVGALFVGGIETVWAGEVTPPMGRRVGHRAYGGDAGPAPSFARGAEIGRFNMGSTVILLFGRDRVAWDARLGPRMRVRMGEAIGRSV